MNTNNKQLIAQFRLPAYTAGKSFSDAAKSINSKFEGRNDIISINTKNELLKRLSQAQEYLKSQEQPEENISQQMAMGGYVNRYDNGGNPTIGTSDSEMENDNTEEIPNGEKNNGYITTYNNIASPIANSINSSGNDVNRTQMTQGISNLGTGVGSAIGGVTGSNIGKGVSAAAGLYDMGAEAFGKSNVDTSGMQSMKGASAGKSAGAGALKGAGTGATIGSIIPGVGTVIGAGVGALVGGVAGFVGGKKDEKAQRINNNKFATNVNNQFSDQYALGGIIDPPVKNKPLTQEEYLAYRAYTKPGYGVKTNYTPDLRTPEQAMMDYQYLRDSAKPGFKVDSGYRPNLTDPATAKLLYDKHRANQFAQGGGLTSEDRGSDKKPYPSVSSSDFAGGGRSYPIPTKADAVDALRLAGLHGRSDVKTKVYNKYPSLKNNYAKGGKINSVNELQPIGNTNINTAPTIEDFKSTPILNNQEYQPSNYEKLRMGLQDTSKFANKVGDYISDNSDLLRYTPAVMNAVQLTKLKKPTGIQLARLDNRYRPEYVDMAQHQNIANQELNNVSSAIQQSGASEGAIRSSLLAAQLNKNKALSNAYMNAQAQNAQQNIAGQQFNLGVDQTNLQQSNLQQDINDKNIGNYDTQKSRLQSQLGTDLGNIGKEELFKKYPERMGLKYDSKGNLISGAKQDEKGIWRDKEGNELFPTNKKSNGGYLNSDMVAHINNMYINRNKK